MRIGREDINIYNVEEIAELFGVNRMTVYRWNKNGLLRLKKIGKRYYAQKKDLETLLDR